MSESITQGIPFLLLDDTFSIKLVKCNDITFSALKREGYICNNSRKKPDQLVIYGEDKKQILIGIEEKLDDTDIDVAVQQIKDNYLDALPDTRYFIARAGRLVKVLYRTDGNLLVEINTLKKGFQAICFGTRVITNENKEAAENLTLLASRALGKAVPKNNELEINPEESYYDPLFNNSGVIKSLWQKIFVCTGEQAHKCLATFVELLVYKGISDANLLPRGYRIDKLAEAEDDHSLTTYKSTVRGFIRNNIFPCMPGQPGVIEDEGFAFTGQETTFKSVLSDLGNLGNIAHRKLDPDFKRRVLETFLGSSNREGKIKNGQHITPRNVVQSVWRMANPAATSKVVDLACGVGGFVLEGLNYPFDFDYRTFRGLGIDKSRQMITLAKSNMVLHLLNVIAENPTAIASINVKINETFLYTDVDGTGTLSEILPHPSIENDFVVKHDADYVFANVPFFSSGVSEIDKSLKAFGGKDKFYNNVSGLGIESRFITYIVNQIQNMNPGLAFVIVPEGILKNINSKTRDYLKEKTDVLAIIAFPKGMFENNNWKTYMLVFQAKSEINSYSKVMLYNVKNIGISLDQFRSPIEQNDLITMESAWSQRLAGESDDPNCHFISRQSFNSSEKWSTLFEVFEDDIDDTISFSESIQVMRDLEGEMLEKINEMENTHGELFNYEHEIELSLSSEEYFKIFTPDYKPTIRIAKQNKGKYPLFSSQISGPVEYMYVETMEPILFKNELIQENEERLKIISWNIKGDAAKDVRLHEEPFYGTENRGLIEVLDKENIDINYLTIFLKEKLVELGKFNRANEAHVGKVRNINVKFPALQDEDGTLILDKQKQEEIVSSYREFIDFKKEVAEVIEQLQTTLGKINILK
ncbi:TPA: N-6 DNA methylase [Bacillus cereus]|nr:N-6 DNA methylase [Bacillus cereus]